MKEKYIQILGTVFTAVYFVIIVFLYWTEPRTLSEVPAKAASTIEKATTTAQVITGTYEVDPGKFNEGLAAFRQDNFLVARDQFQKADPESRDARTQFYIAYSYYRQGWGRVSNDDALFKQGLEAVNRVIALDNNFKSDDANLQMKTPVELKREFEDGLTITAGDFNPLRLVRERK
jgi:hypothetical protein